MEKSNYTCVSSRGRSVVDYMITTHDNISNCVTCDVDLTSDLIDRYDCITLLSESCKAPDHSMITLQFAHSYNAQLNRYIYGTNCINVNNIFTRTTGSNKRYIFDNRPDAFMNSQLW